MKMRKRVAHLALLLALAALLAGCGAIVVEDAQPVRIGSIVHRNLLENSRDSGTKSCIIGSNE